MTPTALLPGTLAAAAFFWGVRADRPLFGLCLGAVLEAPRVFRRRWELEKNDFNRLSDLCAALFGGLSVIAYVSAPASEAVLRIFRFAPLAVLPLVLGQFWSVKGKVDLSAFFMFLRRSAEKEGFVREIDLGYPYLAFLILAAAPGPARSRIFLLGTAALIAAASWSVRPSRVSTTRWLLSWGLAAAAAWGGLWAFDASRERLFQAAAYWVIGVSGPTPDPARTPTFIGRIGTVQMSDRILFRVYSIHEPIPLLREALYDVYEEGNWFASNQEFIAIAASDPVGSWSVGGSAVGRVLEIGKEISEGAGLLPLPEGASRIEGIPAESLEKGRLGALRISGAPLYSRYKAVYSEGGDEEAPPSPRDLRLPDAEKKAVLSAAREWGLSGARPAAAISRILEKFDSEFEYALYQGESVEGGAIEDFLFRSKRGHCEYFASAAVLLLRAAGVPARYAAGYFVSERARFEDGFIVRGRHAHAWARAFVGGRWVSVDATPASWRETVGRGRRPFRSAVDLWDALAAAVRAWRWRPIEEKGGRRWWLWLLAGVGSFIVWRNFRDWRPRGAREAAQSVHPGEDSELFGVELTRARAGQGRSSAESMRAWCERMAGLEPERGALWREVLILHERLRFDPKGLTPQAREKLSAAAKELLAP